MRILVIACLLATACGVGLDNGSEDSAATDGGTTAVATQHAWLDPQNAVRAGVSPAPSTPMPALTWSEGATSVAQAWANNCVYQHNAGRGNRGENIAATAPPGNRDESAVVGLWAGEVSDYTYSTNSCTSGKECGHYTQIVWASTLRAGCAKQTCTTSSPFGSQFPNWDFWVCDYEPPGNFVGQKPY
jgi:pathogenesis-related protein 1